MCAPALAIPIAGGLSIAQPLIGYLGQKQEANDQQKYQNKVYAQTAKVATENYLHTIDTTNLRLQQDTAQSSETAQQNAVAAASARGNAIAAAGEAGVEGNSVQLLLNNFSRIEATNNANLYTNLLWEQRQAHEDMISAQAAAKSQIAQAAPAPVHQPSILGAALQIGTAALQQYDNFNQRNQRGPYDPQKRNPIF